MCWHFISCQYSKHNGSVLISYQYLKKVGHLQLWYSRHLIHTLIFSECGNIHLCYMKNKDDQVTWMQLTTSNTRSCCRVQLLVWHKLLLFIESAARVDCQTCKRDWQRDEETPWNTEGWIWRNNQETSVIYRPGNCSYFNVLTGL